jgi:hypothetical protein
MLCFRSPFGVSADSSSAPVSRVGRSSASKLRSFEHSFLLRATTAHAHSGNAPSRAVGVVGRNGQLPRSMHNVSDLAKLHHAIIVESLDAAPARVYAEFAATKDGLLDVNRRIIFLGTRPQPAAHIAKCSAYAVIALTIMQFILDPSLAIRPEDFNHQVSALLRPCPTPA